MNDVAAQHEAWQRNGPPVSIALVGIARVLGLDLLPKREAQREELDVAPDAPTITDLIAGLTMPGPGGDTAAASRALIAKLNGTP